MRKLLIVFLATLSLFMSCNRDKRNSDGTKAFRVGVTVQSLENSYWAGVFGDVEKIMDEKGWQYTVLSCNDNANTQIQSLLRVGTVVSFKGFLNT